MDQLKMCDMMATIYFAGFKQNPEIAETCKAEILSAFDEKDAEIKLLTDALEWRISQIRELKEKANENGYGF